MSILQLINDETNRPDSVGTVVPAGTVVSATARSTQSGKSKSAAAIEALIRYIPTEIITLYIAASSAMAALKKTFPIVTEANTYWFFVVATPLVFMIIYAGERRSKGLSVVPMPHKWPWWKLVASTIAFAAWALAVPTTPYLTGVEGGAIAGFLATFVSVGLSLLAPLFEKSSA